MVISTSPLVKTYTRVAKEIEVRSFEAGKTAVYTFPDTLRSEVLPKIEIPVATVLS